MPQTRVRYNDLFKRYHLVLVDDNNDVLVDLGYLMPDNTKQTAGIETILPETFNPFSDGSILRIDTAGVKHKYSPAGLTAKDRGAALDAAASATQNGDKVLLNPFYYQVGKTITWAANHFTLFANGATVIRNNTPTDRVMSFNTGSSSSNKIFVDRLNINGNGDNITLASERGEGLRVLGDGVFYGQGLYAYNAPVGNTACNFYFDLDDGHIYLLGCVADDPGWANYRFRCRSFEAYNCQSLVTTHKTGAKARFYDMDGANLDEGSIIGGRWFTDQSYEVQAVFDPGPGNNCRKLTLSGIQMNFNKNHQNTTGDGFVKVDEIDEVLFQDITQSHVQPRLHEEFNVYTDSVYEYLLHIGSGCKNVAVKDVQADATIHPSSFEDTIYADNLTIEDCVFGKNAQLGHAMQNLNMIKNISIKNTKFYHVVGTGSQASGNKCVFNNGSSSSHDQKVILDNVLVQINFTEIGSLFRHIREIGHVQIRNFRREVESGSSGLILAPSPTQRLMGAVKLGDQYTAWLQWNPILEEQGTIAPLGTNTWDHHHKAPVDPGSASGDWFGGVIIGKTGSRVLNVHYGNGGNGHPREFVKTAGGTFVDN